ncbi:MAG: ABC transporter ATP-binding protein, partial [Methylobacter tundripaludum]|nr:ABC transporter ATP-binding protein [Methylobacter tundripaludum]
MLPNKTLLEARQLVVNYKNHRAIDELDLSVPAGCVYALLGGNGAGKTSTINTFLGFNRPTEGNVFIDGESPEQNPAVVRAKLAYLPENVALYDYMSGLENLSFFCLLANIRLSHQHAHDLLMNTGLQDDAHDRRVSTYSKGMRQKVGLAIASAKQAKVMLL